MGNIISLQRLANDDAQRAESWMSVYDCKNVDSDLSFKGCH